MTEKIKVQQQSVGGLLWFGGWLFALGFLKLGFWKALLALIIWPYYVGVEVAARWVVG
ncbi:MAG: hypothetical protein KJO11_04590 [Gemmatimonadetes bacterium]|nr:hypothetical protein [Gemmatimonadota bacterium]MBT8405442.1 hypothetical protein [Gemmatimonadota bacterium]NNK63909.1 hypothetical protein [Gemmatimonadota bacterium]